ncbi:MAG: lipopolysaccharide biosynthesis protein [Tenuifilaceae bacterium]|nr:lipopolysaccharide biosynthesis protein [Tenuifilaceae bacterium]
MTSTTLKSKATKGMLWSALDKFAVQAGHFAIGIVLARLLMPEDFGLIGMLSIFIAISQTFIDSGMGSGLIQKKDRSNHDFSTVFVFNLAVSVTFYFILYFSAPLIAQFYSMPQLVMLTRVLSLNIIINSLAIVQRTKLTINIDFKTIAKVNVASVFISGIVAVYFAYSGLGVWALVIQNLVRAAIAVLMLWFLSRWAPSLVFSKESFKNLFGFGSKLLIAGLYARTLQEVYNITIGKFYQAAELGFYTRARSFVDITNGTITSILQQVTYPILASLQDDRDRMVSVYSRLIRMTAFFVFPAMTLLALLAEPFVLFFLTEKWLPAVVLLQLMAFARIFYPISALNMNILNAVGRSDLFLKVDLSKFPVIVLVLIITIPLGVKAIVIGHIVTSFISFFINSYMPGKLFGYGALKQLRDMIPIFIATGIMAALVYASIFLLDSNILKMLIGGFVGISSFLTVSHFMKIEEMKEVQLIFSKIARRK